MTAHVKRLKPCQACKERRTCKYAMETSESCGRYLAVFGPGEWQGPAAACGIGIKNSFEMRPLGLR